MQWVDGCIYRAMPFQKDHLYTSKSAGRNACKRAHVEAFA